MSIRETKKLKSKKTTIKQQLPKKVAKKTSSRKVAKKTSSRKVAKKTSSRKVAKKVTKKPRVKKADKKTSLKNNTEHLYLKEEAFIASIKPYKLSKKEKYMSAKQKHHFNNILEAWKKMLEIEQDRTANKIQRNNSYFADEADRATHEEGFTLEIKTRERERKLLSKIDQSIEDISNGNYGYCTNPYCGVEIGIRRLEARPSASLCIDCKTLQEIEERQKYGQR